MELKSCGTTVWAEQTGSGENRVLLLHGWGCSTELMAPIAARLAPAHSVLSLDFPGFGKSGRPPEPWGVPEYAACVADVLRQLDFTPCAVIAHSFGARVAIWLASEAHAPFTKLILTGAAGIRPKQTEAGKKRSARFKRLKSACEAMKKLRMFGSLPDALENRLRKKYGSPDYNALDEEMRRTFVKVISLDLTDRLPGVCAPTLIMTGDRDTETPLWMAHIMEDRIPDAALIVLEGGTHFAYLEQQERFAAIARAFLKEE